MSFGVLRKEHYLSPNFAPTSLAPYWLSLFCGIDFAAENWLTKASIVEMKFLDWYVKISAGGALIGASMELFMIKTGFYDKVTVLESEKRAWESSPEAQAIREALNPWRNQETEQRKNA